MKRNQDYNDRRDGEGRSGGRRDDARPSFNRDRQEGPRNDGPRPRLDRNDGPRDNDRPRTYERNSERPPRSYDKPRSFDRESGPRDRHDERPQRPFDKPRFDNDRPQRTYDNDRPQRNFDRERGGPRDGRKPSEREERRPFSRDDRPRFDNERRDDRQGGPRKPFNRDERPRFERNDRNTDERPQRSFDRERSPRDEQRPFNREAGPRTPFERRDERPRRSFDGNNNRGDNPRRPFDREAGPRNDRPRFDNDRREPKPRSFERDDRPQRTYDNDRPQRSFDREGSPRTERRPFDRDERKPFKRDERKPVNQVENGDGKPAFDRRTGYYEKAPNYNLGKMKENLPWSKKVAKNLQRESDPNSIRLNRYIANSGVCSRREADELIGKGDVQVNGTVVTEMGYRVKPGDVVKYGNKVLNPEKMVYVLLNKPKDVITTTEDPEERNTVMDMVADAGPFRLYPVGRLDRNTTGLLLMTNDGELASKLTHPSNNVKKVYQVEIDKPITDEHFEAIRNGLELEDGFIKPDDLAIVTPDAQVVGVEIHSGRNRIVRRLFESLGYEVTKLDRTVFAGLTKKELPRGKWRFLEPKEVVKLKYLT
jgi:23S rRNA pseudouridine2605 synthase